MLFCGYVCTRAIEAALKLDIMFYAVMSLVFFILTVLCATLLTYDIYKLNQKGEIINDYWTYIADNMRLHDIKEKISGTNGGKYLLFSKDRNTLLEIAQAIIQFEKIAVCKLSSKPKNNNYVLCVFDTAPIHGKEISAYQREDVVYRGWKSNLKTYQEHNM